MTADPRTVLDEWDALANGATEGPWYSETTDDGQYTMILVPINDQATAPARAMSGNYGEVVSWSHDFPDEPDDHTADAAFIAAARTGWPQAAAAIRAVLALHQPRTVATSGSTDPSRVPLTVTYCQCCYYAASVDAAWPCPTVRAITDPLTNGAHDGE